MEPPRLYSNPPILPQKLTDARSQAAATPRQPETRVECQSQHRLGSSDVAELVELYQLGAGIAELGSRYNIHRATVADPLSGGTR